MIRLILAAVYDSNVTEVLPAVLVIHFRVGPEATIEPVALGLVILNRISEYLQPVLSTGEMAKSHRQVISKTPAFFIGNRGMADEDDMGRKSVFHHPQPLLCGRFFHGFGQVTDNGKVDRLRAAQLILVEWCLQVLQFSIIVYLQT